MFTTKIRPIKLFRSKVFAMKLYKRLLIFCCLPSSLLLSGCQHEHDHDSTHASQTLEANIASQKNIDNPWAERSFSEYWYQGKAELSSFELEQARYGSVHNGTAVMVFVTEDFSKSKLHKLNYPVQNPKDAVSVLKLNFTRDFQTGIYPYKMMQSIFNPVGSGESCLKSTTSIQEWCGHVFSQLNYQEKSKSYQAEIFSYFDGEGEQDFNLDEVFLEDEIWNRIRISPSELPTGDFSILPSSVIVRLKHQDLKPQQASASLEKGQDLNGNPAMVYSLKLKDGRSLEVHFQEEFPHRIESWEEKYVSGYGSGAKMLSSKAKRKKTILLDYWNYNSPEHKALLKDLDIKAIP